MAQQIHVVVLFMLACLFTTSYSYQFTVGGRDGWVLNPSVDYNTWSQHMRFIINDSVLFKYKQGADSVLEVSKDDYDKCNTGNPIKKMEDGNSIFTLDRSGPFYFISGNKDNCDKGQKLQIVVISARNQGKPPQTPAPGVAPPSNGSTTPPSTPSGGSTPAAAPSKGSSTPGTPSAPSANAPAGSSTPGASSPNGAPVSTPAGKSPTPSGSTASPPSPATVVPAMSPVENGPSTSTPGSSSPVAGGPSSGSGIAPSAGGPSGSAIAPAADGPTVSMSPGPSAGGPMAGGPSGGAPGSSALGPGGSSTPADINTPAGAPENPNSFAVKAFTPSVVLVSAVSLVLTVTLAEFIILP
ncbi:hypothetical protein EJD97_010463 [Solanum chilense]|uniref:Phytocyanin domain-containing protein n=1 Tax=Solanum chilense TaxID=4083 RepID=A0A6N2BGL3_SOLCI|nr:hypothetical protein EJD97_010463 [Solanum chilense]